MIVSMMGYFFAGYYLIQLKPVQFGSYENKTIYTCSCCINDDLIKSWLIHDFDGKNEYIKELKENFNFSQDEVKVLTQWLHGGYEQGKIIYPNIFSEIKFAKEYKNKFIKKNNDIKLFAIYFCENQKKNLFNVFKNNENGFYRILEKSISEKNNKEIFIGYDLVGIDDIGFHTFHCHDIGKELCDKFKITLNEYGLFNYHQNWNPILDYMNGDESAVEPVPWFVVKVKLVSENL
jgi:hypothetical protein